MIYHPDPFSRRFFINVAPQTRFWKNGKLLQPGVDYIVVIEPACLRIVEKLKVGAYFYD
jgi:hypothetical protein